MNSLTLQNGLAVAIVLAAVSGCSREGPAVPAVYALEGSADETGPYVASFEIYAVMYSQLTLLLQDDVALFHRTVVESRQTAGGSQSPPETPILGPWPYSRWRALFPTTETRMSQEDGFWVLRDEYTPEHVVTVLHPLDDDWQRIALGQMDAPYEPGNTVLRLLPGAEP